MIADYHEIVMLFHKEEPKPPLSVANLELDIIELNSESFEPTVTFFDSVLVEFHVKWCSTCQVFAPIFQKIGNDLKIHNVTNLLRLASVNADENQNLAQKYSLVEYPTLLLFSNGHHQKIDINNVHASIEEHLGLKIWNKGGGMWPWMSVYNTRPSSPDLTDTKSIKMLNEKNYLNLKGKYLIHFHAGWSQESTDVNAILTDAVKLQKTLNVYQLDIDQFPLIAKHFGVAEVPTLFVYNNGVFAEEIIPDIDSVTEYFK